jgi:mono/diheme cytochrome c family protein
MKAARCVVSGTLTCLALAISSAGVGSLTQQAPPEAALRLNPLEGREDARRAGAKLYARECASCHGRDGAGLGKAPPLNRPDVYDASPGTLFWVLRNGSSDRGMPSFAHLPAPQRWQIVTYLRAMRPVEKILEP